MRPLLAAGLALLVGACMAGPSRQGPPPGFGEEEGDGPPSPRAQLFISPSGQPFRAPAGGPYPSAAWFAAADRDRDGRLTRDEFRADAEAWFKVIDADGDGQLGMPEATRWEEELVPEASRVATGSFGGSRRGFARIDPGSGVAGRNELNTRLQGASAYSLINEPHPVRGADADFDFRVTRAEWRTAADRRFALLDPDGDGAMLATELRQTLVQGRPARPRTPPPRTMRRPIG